MRITAADSGIIKAGSEKIFNTILDLNSYKLWWPGNTLFKVLNDVDENEKVTLWIRPFGGPGFGYRIKSIEENKQINVEYFKGVYSGTGIWRLSGFDSEISLNYSVDIEVKNFFVNTALKIFNGRKIHSAVMKKVFSGLNMYLDKK